jgi:hypothetical protein
MSPAVETLSVLDIAREEGRERGVAQERLRVLELIDDALARDPSALGALTHLRVLVAIDLCPGLVAREAQLQREGIPAADSGTLQDVKP